jgi:hypothetical protein
VDLLKIVRTMVKNQIFAAFGDAEVITVPRAKFEQVFITVAETMAKLGYRWRDSDLKKRGAEGEGDSVVLPVQSEGELGDKLGELKPR